MPIDMDKMTRDIAENAKLEGDVTWRSYLNGPRGAGFDTFLRNVVFMAKRDGVTMPVCEVEKVGWFRVNVRFEICGPAKAVAKVQMRVRDAIAEYQKDD